MLIAKIFKRNVHTTDRRKLIMIMREEYRRASRPTLALVKHDGRFYPWIYVNNVDFCDF